MDRLIDWLEWAKILSFPAIRDAERDVHARLTQRAWMQLSRTWTLL
jgi:hypothetical protein